jgi:arginine-tRNA-protein transferase
VDTVYSNLDEGRRANIKLSYLAFYRFLGETPVAAHCITNDSSHPFHPDYDVPYGTYHQQYRLSTSRDGFDGPLIAVGVTDILPHCLSSVYSFYDPILSSKLELGKYTALREIEWVRRASRLRPDLHYYYLGEMWASRT